MLKNVWFQIHWFTGITAGVVLAVVGLTGGILSFERDIQEWLNSDVQKVEPVGTLLTPAVLAAEMQRQYPGRRITAFNFSSEPTQSVRVTFAPEETDGVRSEASRRDGPRGKSIFVNPYTATVIAGEGTRGQDFFRMTRSLHRWLTAGEFGNQQIGKQIVGASTLLCVVLALSGLYLRWPRRLSNWRTWLTFDPLLRGRSFLWHLHAVLGTWVLVAFLLMSLTGLYWSYDWYRNGLYALAGVERPARRSEQRDNPVARGRERQSGDSTAGSQRSDAGNAVRIQRREDLPALDLEQVWTQFKAATAVSGFSSVTITLPQQSDRPVEVRYVDAKPVHDRASNTLALHAITGEIVRHERYDEKRVGEKFISSIFPLHSGSFFGVPGKLLYMLASLAMPVFTVTGWMMYLDRRRKKRAANLARNAACVSVSSP